jgi:DNA polymerase-3 subunit epsilon
MAYPPMGRVYRKFLRIMGKYIDKYNPKDKAWLVGFNNRGFDDRFLRAWFEQNNDMYIGSWFWSDTLDVMVLASEYLLKRRSEMPSFKLKRVALELGLDVEAERLHDAYYDVELTRSIYRIVTGLDVEF